jgi:hypothetical protein
MSTPWALIDVAPDPVGIGIVAVVVLMVIGSIILLVTALVVFLWLRKRSMGQQEMIRPDDVATESRPH